MHQLAERLAKEQGYRSRSAYKLKQLNKAYRIIGPEFCGARLATKILATASLESELPPIYYTLDEIAKKSKTAPPKLADAIGMLQNSGYAAGPTSFDPTGFRTNATFEQITECIL